MNTATGPIVATTTLSILLHSVVAVALLAVNDEEISPNQTDGHAVAVELIRSIKLAEQLQTDVQREQRSALSRQDTLPAKVSEAAAENTLEQSQKAHIPVLASLSSDAAMSVREVVGDGLVKPMIDVKQPEQDHFESDSIAQVMPSTNASEQRHSILELLHSQISNNKKYPYLARRQRREGVTTVAFVLHPDGSIENTHTIHSSQTIALDRAALSAVKGIEPFNAAQHYLEQAEEFHVDVVFKFL